MQLPDRPTTLQRLAGERPAEPPRRCCCWLEFALAVLSDVLGRIVSLLDALLAEQFSNSPSVRLMEHAATLDLEDFEDASCRTGSSARGGRPPAASTLMGQLFGQAQDLVTVVELRRRPLVYAPWLIVLLAGWRWCRRSSARRTSTPRPTRSTSAARPSGASSTTSARPAASVETAKEVKIFGLNGFLIERYKRAGRELLRRQPALAVKRAAWGGAVHRRSAPSATTPPTPTSSGARCDGEFSDRRPHVPRRARSCGCARLLEGLLTGFSSTAGQALYLNDLFSFFDIAAGDPVAGQCAAVPACRSAQGFVFEDVGFSYPGAERWAVRHLSFTLQAGEVLALVGENGAGKTTLVKLLTRLYDPDEGRILLDGLDLREYDLDDLRGSMGVIFQDFVRYNFSAGDNIAVGRIEARDDHAAHRARRRAQPGRRGDRRRCRAATTSASASASRTASSCRAANGRRWRSPAPTCARPRC